LARLHDRFGLSESAPRGSDAATSEWRAIGRRVLFGVHNQPQPSQRV